MSTKNHFATLGLKVGAGEDEIKKAYRSLAKQWHPDKNKNPGAEEKFKEIAASYDFLQSKDRRDILEREINRKFTFTTNQQGSSTSPKTTATDSNSSEHYSWEFKGRESSKNNDSNFSKESKENVRPETKKKRAPHWSDSFRKRNNKNKEPASSWKAWTGDWTFDEDKFSTPTPPPKFSDAFSKFRTFVDRLDEEFAAFFPYAAGDSFKFTSSLFGDGDLFEEAFSTPAWGSFEDSARRKNAKKHSPRNVASEHGFDGGLDQEYMFSPPLRTEKTKINYLDKSRCPVCNKLITAQKMAKHEQKCGKFDSSSESSDDIIDDSGRKSVLSDEFIDDDLFKWMQDRDWRSTHEEVINRIRQDRKAYKQKLYRESSEEHECGWCGQTFTLRAFKRHIGICMEHVLRFGKPMNPLFTGGPATSTKFAHTREHGRNCPQPQASSQKSYSVPKESDTFSSDSEHIPTPSPSPGSHAKSKFGQKPKASLHKENVKMSAPNKPRMGRTTSTSTQPKSRQPGNSKLPNDTADLGFLGTGFRPGAGLQRNQKSGGTGCDSCQKKFGTNSKFSCSCGVKNSAAL